MNNCKYIRIRLMALLLLWLPMTMIAQDTILNRNVTVERDFQPIISSAGIVSVKPVIVQEEFKPAEVTYSSYSQALAPAHNINPLGCSLTSWNQPKPLHGYVSGGLGHTNTAFDFEYRISDKRSKIDLDAFAHHQARWGRYTTECTQVGLNVTKTFSSAALYFGADAMNRFYTHSGRYVDSTGVMHLKNFGELLPEDKLSLWTVNTHIGIRSTARSSIQYKLQTGYSVFLFGSAVTEHQIRTLGGLVWSSLPHSAGVNVEVGNFFMDVKDATIAPTDYNARHAIRIEPFYAYDNERLHAHIGVNLDMNIGRGQLLSGNKALAFAPSPNVRLEYDITRNWLAIYGEARGSLGEGSLESHAYAYPYRSYRSGVTSHHVSSYIPVQAQLGLKIQPEANLLVDVFARYEWMKNQMTTCTPYYWEVRQQRESAGADKQVYGDYVYSHLQRWKIGAEITYHYQDIVRVLVAGGFYLGSMDSIEAPHASQGNAADEASLLAAVTNADGTLKMLDRERWDLRVNIDARIDRHWSLYSHNYFAGSRQVLMYKETTTGREYSTRVLSPTIDINLGCMYEYNKWLSVFLELNNVIYRHNALYYGYADPGTNFLLGVTYKF